MSKKPSEGMKRYTGTVSIGLVGCLQRFEFDAPDDATEEEVEELAREAMWECVEWNYQPVEE